MDTEQFARELDHLLIGARLAGGGDTIAEVTAEIGRGRIVDLYGDSRREADALRAENARFREALDMYADPENWINPADEPGSGRWVDGIYLWVAPGTDNHNGHELASRALNYCG